VELYQLRSFVEVADLGHLTRAADRLHISQPALSAQIKALEEELEVELFERSSSGMALTPAGKRLIGEAKKLLSAAQALRNEARSIKGTVSGIARLGTVSDPEFIRVGALMSAAVERYPLVEIQFHHEVSGAAFEKVRDGVLDASFYYGGFTHPEVAALDLREITYRIVAPAAWKERIDGATWTDIAREPWIMTPPISTHSQLAAALFSAHTHHADESGRGRRRGRRQLTGAGRPRHGSDARRSRARKGRRSRDLFVDRRPAHHQPSVRLPARSRAGSHSARPRRHSR
jgi:DNA-binding transcriptional LysR family regulator